MKKILIIGPSWVGDMAMAHYFIFGLKSNIKNSIIDIIAPKPAIELAKLMPEINNALALPFKHGELNLTGRYKFAQDLRANNYDLAFILPNSFKSALIPWFAKIPNRIGWLGEMRYGLLTKAQKLNKSNIPLMKDRYLELLRIAGLTIDNNIKPKLNISPTNKDNILVLCPGAEFGPAKQWPAQNFAKVAKYFLNKDYKVWILGSNKDNKIAEQINNLLNNQAQNFTGKTSLTQAIKFISQAKIMVTNDSGLMHVAAAFDVPQVTLFGATSPKFTPPLSEKSIILQSKVPCSPCFKRECPLDKHLCMVELSPQLVIDNLNSTLLTEYKDLNCA